MERNFSQHMRSPYRGALRFGFLGIGLFCLLSSCIVSRHPYAIISSTKPISPNYVILTSVEESSCSPWFLLIPLGGKSSSEEIIAGLEQQNGADALVGVTVEHEESLFSIPIMGNECTNIKGQAVKVIN